MRSISIFRLIQDLVVYVLFVTSIVVLRVCVEPYHRGFYCDDESIRYPNASSTISMLTLALVGIILPLIIIFSVETYRLIKVEPRMHSYDSPIGSQSDTVCEGQYLGDRLIHPLLIRMFTYAAFFLFGAAVCETFTHVAKITVGSLRPHFLDACQPDWSAINCSNHRYVTDFVCLNTDAKLIKEARQSFPSGHASFAAYCACFAVLYMRRRASWPLSPDTGRLVRPFIQYALILAAFGTGLTRIADNQHRAIDVAFGFLVGIFSAWATCYHFGMCGSSKESEDRAYRKMSSASLERIGDKETSALLYQE